MSVFAGLSINCGTGSIELCILTGNVVEFYKICNLLHYIRLLNLITGYMTFGIYSDSTK